MAAALIQVLFNQYQKSEIYFGGLLLSSLYMYRFFIWAPTCMYKEKSEYHAKCSCNAQYFNGASCQQQSRGGGRGASLNL